MREESGSLSSSLLSSLDESSCKVFDVCRPEDVEGIASSLFARIRRSSHLLYSNWRSKWFRFASCSSSDLSLSSPVA